MNQTLALIQTLKQQLKLRGKTYLDVANHLGLSQVSIKRLFKEGQLSVSRLESICVYIDLSLVDLMLLTNIEQTTINCLSNDQEQEIVADLLLLLVSLCVINGYTYRQIIEQYDISEPECIQKLVRLDRLKVIDLLPNNRIKLRISASFTWLPNGPIQQFFQRCVKQEFFQCRFTQPTEKLLVVNGLLSLGSNAEIQKKMQKLICEFVDLKKADTVLDMEHKHGTTLVVATRQWNSSLFNSLERKE